MATASLNKRDVQDLMPQNAGNAKLVVAFLTRWSEVSVADSSAKQLLIK